MKFFRGVRVRRRVPRSKTYRTRKTVRKAKAQSFAKKVLKVIHRQAENKVWIAYQANNNITTASSSTFTNVSLMPTMSQGTGHSNRVGDDVTVVKARINGYVNLLPYNSVSNPTVGPLYVRMWVLSVRNMQNAQTLSTSTLSSNFFETNGGSAGPQGNILDMCLSVNKQNFIIHKVKTVLLEAGATQGSTYYNSAGGSCGGSGRFSAPFSFDVTRHLGKLKFDDTSPVSPVNKNLFLAFQAVYADGTSLALTPAEFSYNYRVEFEDL